MNTYKRIVRELQVKLGMEIKLEQMKLNDGVTTIEAEVFEAGAEVFVVTEDDQKIALPIGEYELENGMMLIVQQEGVISEMKEKEAEEEAQEEVAEETGEMAQEPQAPATPQPKSIIESTSKEYKFEELEAKIVELEAKILELSKQPEIVEEVVELEAEPKPIVFNPENKEEVEQVQVAHTRLDRIFNIINND